MRGPVLSPPNSKYGEHSLLVRLARKTAGDIVHRHERDQIVGGPSSIKVQPLSLCQSRQCAARLPPRRLSLIRCYGIFRLAKRTRRLAAFAGRMF